MRQTKFVLLLLIISYVSSVGFAFAQNDATRYKVYLFLSESCPICIHYTLPLKDITKEYSTRGFEFIGVFPNPYSTDSTMQEFKTKYNLNFNFVKDSSLTITRKFGAKITPEVFVFDAKLDSVLYRGRIDNQFVRVGRKRTIVTSNDLKDALKAIVQNKKVATPVTEAVGCFIAAHPQKVRR